MISENRLIVQLPRGGAVDRHFRADPPPSVTSGRAGAPSMTGQAIGRHHVRALSG
jgi:hypothetical protein